MVCELWDMTSGNLIADFGDRASALAFVREEVSRGGPSVVKGLALLVVTEGGRSSETIAENEELLPLIRATAKAKS